jgi:hypothetical protein
MERILGSANVYQPKVEKIPHGPLCETPRENGSKPAKLPRIPEQIKKHIKRDGKK